MVSCGRSDAPRASHGKNEYLSRADELIRAFAGETGHNFFPLGTWASGFAARLRTIQIVLIGPREARAPLRRAVLETALPARVLFEVEEEAGLPEGHPARGKRTTDAAPPPMFVPAKPAPCRSRNLRNLFPHFCASARLERLDLGWQQPRLLPHQARKACTWPCARCAEDRRANRLPRRELRDRTGARAALGHIGHGKRVIGERDALSGGGGLQRQRRLDEKRSPRRQRVLRTPAASSQFFQCAVVSSCSSV